MITLGIVGGMGSGKSWVSEYLAHKGCCVFNADEAARKILQLPIINQQLRARWLIDPYGFVTREGLPKVRVIRPFPDLVLSDGIARIVFNFVDELRFLEKIMAPHLDLELKTFLANLATDYIPIVIIDAPLLYEIGWDKLCHSVLFVDAPLETRIKRIAERRNDSIENAQQTIVAREANLVVSIAEKKSRADYVILNDGVNDRFDVLFDELKSLSCSLNPDNKY